MQTAQGCNVGQNDDVTPALRSTPSVYTWDRAASISSGLTLPGGREDGGLAQVIADQAGPQGWR